jgi:hypothetical protein
MKTLPTDCEECRSDSIHFLSYKRSDSIHFLGSPQELMDGSCDSLGCALGLGLALGPIDMVGVEVGSAVAIVGATVGVTVTRAVRTSMPPTLLAT